MEESQHHPHHYSGCAHICLCGSLQCIQKCTNRRSLSQVQARLGLASLLVLDAGLQVPIVNLVVLVFDMIFFFFLPNKTN